MKAFVHENGKLTHKEMASPVAKAGEVVISLRVAGLNRRDLSVPKRRDSKTEALILGSDGAGVITEIGEGVRQWEIGDEVIINPSLGWEEETPAPPETFDILGMPNHGTFAEKVKVKAEQIEEKPVSLSWEEAGVLSLSALTAYRALFTKGQIKKGDTLFIPGAGSGVATYLISYAKNIGAKVVVTSRDQDKLAQAKKLGADITLDTNADWVSELKNETIDLIMESVGKATFNRSLEILKKGGRMVVFGATTDDTVNLNLREFFYGQYELIGSTMGSKQELEAMLEHIEQYKTLPVVDTIFSLHEAKEAFEYLETGKQFGKVALKISD